MPTQGMSKGRRVLRVAIGAVLVATCLRVWAGPGDWAPRAHAQIPNAGAQRADLLREVRRTNQLLEQVLAILRSQAIKVEVQGIAGAGGAKPRPVRQRPNPGK